MKDVFDEYFAALLDADTALATSVLDAALQRGVPPVRLILDVVALGQQRLGEAWEAGNLSVAAEHAATAVAEQALAIVSHVLLSHDQGKRVVVACAEGEWHSMPARLAAALARAGGVQVTMLGGSLSAEHLHQHLRRTRPDALALSVTLTSNLEGAAASVRAAHRAGVPVIVGGAAWGPDDRLATSMGADLWLRDAQALPTALDALIELPG